MGCVDCESKVGENLDIFTDILKIKQNPILFHDKNGNLRNFLNLMKYIF
jgi:hypothetical protein